MLLFRSASGAPTSRKFQRVIVIDGSIEMLQIS